MSLESTVLADETPRLSPTTPGSHLVLDSVTVRSGDDTLLVSDVSLTAAPGELIAVVGASGSGKSTLLDVMAGNLPPSDGTALVDGTEAHSLSPGQRRSLAFIPQDDVMNEDLPLGRMLAHSARLRLPRGTSIAQVQNAVATALEQVDLTKVAHLPVKQLSGGQRRRASVATELVTSPAVCLLDEPTSGLDPTTAETIVEELRALADKGRTIVFVTHNANDLRRCDRIIALAPAGRIVFDGSPEVAMTLVGSNDTDEVHRALTTGLIESRRAVEPRPWARLYRLDHRGRAPSPWTQWCVLTARSLESILRNRLTLAIMIGSPAMVIAMFAVLFRPGAFDPVSPSPTSAIMIAFWVAFGGFFFGLTYGLLQICPEVAIMRRERRGGVSPGLQILAKLAALAPMLLAIDVAMLAILVWLDRLPSADMGTYAAVAVTLALDALAALSLGLLASALVRSPAQAALALPMLCFPAVLFSGAVLPVPVMAPVGQAISAAMPDRWAFELIGRDLGLRALFAADSSPLGPALLAEYDDTWTVSRPEVWLLLATITVALSLAAWIALSIRCRQDNRSRSNLS